MPKPIENTERINVHLPKEQLDALKAKAKRRGMTVSGYMRMLAFSDLGETKPTQTAGVNHPVVKEFGYNELDAAFRALE